jgi:hypothetical protein
VPVAPNRGSRRAGWPELDQTDFRAREWLEDRAAGESEELTEPTPQR